MTASPQISVLDCDASTARALAREHRRIAEAYMQIAEAKERAAVDASSSLPTTLPIAAVAAYHKVTKDAARKQIKRRGVGISLGGRVHIRREDLAHLYESPSVSELSTSVSHLSDCAVPAASVILPAQSSRGH